MHPYFKNMPTFGKALSDKKKAKAEDNKKSILEVEAKVAEEILRVKNAGLPAEKIHSRGQLTVWGPH